MSSRTEQEDMDAGTSEQSPGLSSYQTHAKEGGSSGPQERVAPAKKGKVGPGPGDLQGQTESLSQTPGRVTWGHLKLPPEPPKRPESPLLAQYKDLRKITMVDRHKAQASRGQSWGGEQRTLTVNRVRGADSIREAA